MCDTHLDCPNLLLCRDGIILARLRSKAPRKAPAFLFANQLSIYMPTKLPGKPPLFSNPLHMCMDGSIEEHTLSYRQQQDVGE